MALEVFAHASTVAAALFAALAPVSAVGLGLAPRAGPARAIALALTSRLRAAATVSQRAADVRALQTSLRCAEADQYIIVCGPTGVGKTCVVETATQRTCGVVSVRVAAGASSDTIARQALSAIARVQLAAAFFDVLPSARRVIFWHRLLALGRPTVVLQLSERRLGADYADVAGSARELVGLGLAVVIDASDNALEPGALATERQVVLELEPMPRQTLESIAALEPLRAALQRAGLRDLVWAALGGSPAAHRRLFEQWAEAAFDEGRLAPFVQAFVQRQLVASMSRRDFAVAGDARLPRLYAHFAAGAEHVPRSALREMHLRLPSPDKVLRAVQRCGAEVLIPADAAMALVLRYDLQVAPPLPELQALLARGGNEPLRGPQGSVA